MKYNEAHKRLFNRIIFAATAACFFGCSQPSPLKKMTPPIIIVRKDSAIVVEDKNGRIYNLTLSEKTKYGIEFMELGDTIIYK